MHSLTRRINSKWPAAPGNAATIVMVSTMPKLVGSLNSAAAGAITWCKGQDGRDLGLAANSISAVEIVWLENDQASAASNAVRLYAIKSDWVTWREVDCKDDSGNPTIGASASQTVGTLLTPAERRILIDVSRYPAFAVEYTAGATGPTAWDGIIMLHINAQVVIK